MPQLQAAKKDLRKNRRRRAVNDRWRKAMRSSLHAVRDAISSKDKPAAQAAYPQAQATLDRAAKHHIIHPNRAARKKSRLLKAIANISSAPHALIK